MQFRAFPEKPLVSMFYRKLITCRKSLKVNFKVTKNLTLSSHGMQQFEVVHRHLQDLRFLQLGRALQRESATSHPVASDFIELVFVFRQRFGMKTLKKS